MSKNLVEIKRYEILAGSDINSVAIETINIAKENDCIVEFDFNGISLRAYYFSSSQELVDKYYKELNKKKK